MRLWSVHPRHLDRQGLTACWREALLAQAVLRGTTKGYRNHPQLVRFRAAGPEPSAAVTAVATYLEGVRAEAVARGYRYDPARIAVPPDPGLRLPVTDGQLRYEWAHLLGKLAVRSPEVHRRWVGSTPEPHPVLDVVPGPVEPWEVLGPPGPAPPGDRA